MNKLVVLVTKLAAAFPRDNATEATLAVYIEQLQNCNLDLLERIINEAIANAQRLPTIAELRTNYRAHINRQDYKHEALPLGRSPIPPEVKKELDRFLRRMDERSEELQA